MSKMPNGDRPAAKFAQVKRLLDALDGSSAEVTLVAGDFNCGPAGLPLRRFIERGYTDAGADAGATAPTFLDGSDGRIDDQLFRAIRRPAFRVAAFARVFDGDPAHGHEPRASDHAGLIGAYRL